MSQPTDVTLRSRFTRAWNAFRGKDMMILEHPEGFDGDGKGFYVGPVHSTSWYPSRTPKLISGKNETIINSIYNRIANDVCLVKLQHVRLDEEGNYVETMRSGLNNVLNYEANVDQSGRQFIHDLVLTMLDYGVVAAVPIDTTIDPLSSDSYDITSIRVGTIVEWYPMWVRVDVYNDRTGIRQQVTLPKKMVSIIENPFYSVMNAPNSVLQRLLRRLAMLDVSDERATSGKLDLIIQLPYAIKNSMKEKQAADRATQIEQQLQDSAYGIAYIDGTERVTQLNRPVENTLMAQIEYLTSMLYSQLGITPEILSGNAEEGVMKNYQQRVVDVVLNAIIDEFERKFITKTARTQGQAIRYFRNMFALATTESIADAADRFTRNEILTSNEFRSLMGFKPSKDPDADELRNKNLNKSENEKQVTELIDVDEERTRYLEDM